jgi:H/ACA ribonucleoprotein complex subunit 4
MENNIDFNRYIIVIDKPAGPTSFQVTDFIKKSLGVSKAAHSGTLDPEVTGVLPVLLGRASRLLDYFIHRDKEYVGVMHIHEDIERKKIEDAILKKFLGKIKQLPPVKSRVKREEREREIKRFDILEQEEKDFLFCVKCEAGTYVRKLIHDLGQELKTGAHMTELRRTHASLFDEQDSVTLYQFTDAVKEYSKGNPKEIEKMLVPIEIITRIMPTAEISDDALAKVLHGSPIFRELLSEYGKFNKNDFIALMNNNKLIGIAQAEVSSNEADNSDLIAKPKTIFN